MVIAWIDGAVGQNLNSNCGWKQEQFWQPPMYMGALRHTEFPPGRQESETLHQPFCNLPAELVARADVWRAGR